MLKYSESYTIALHHLSLDKLIPSTGAMKQTTGALKTIFTFQKFIDCFIRVVPCLATGQAL